MNTALSAGDVLACVKRLPPLPRAVHELAEALRHDGLPTERIVASIGADQALAGMVLKLANSPFYGVRGRVGSLRDAVQMLGLNTLSSAVTTAAVMNRFDRVECAGFDAQACWQHALATAVCAQALAAPRGFDPDAAYTAGLLHDLGRLALASHFPAAFSASLEIGVARDLPPVLAEREAMGIDHACVGGMIAAHWGLPRSLVDTIRHHHELPAGNAPTLPDLLHLADSIVHALDLCHEPDDMVPPLAPGLWERLAPTDAELQQVFAHVETRVLGMAAIVGAGG